MDNVICKAKIKTKFMVVPIIIWYIIGTIAFISTFHYKNYPYREKIETNILGFHDVHYNDYDVVDIYFFNKRVYSKYTDLDPYYPDDAVRVEFCEYGEAWIAVLITIGIFIVPISIIIIQKFIAKRCSLELNEKTINGQRKRLFSKAKLDLPIDKIDSIMVKKSLYNTLTGGKTIAIRTASGLIKFPWVHNADEFVDITLAKMEEYKQTMKDDNQALISAVASNSGGSAADKIKELKGLLDEGIISQEDFERKKKELIDKM